MTGETRPSPLMSVDQTQPIDHAHCLDQVALEVQMDAVILGGLNTHVPSPHEVHASLPTLLLHALFKQGQCLVTLRQDPFVRLVCAGGVWGDEQARPEGSSRVEEVWSCVGGCVEDSVQPVGGGGGVEVVPEAVAEDEGVWFGWFGRGQEGIEAVDFCAVKREAEHHFDDEVDWGVAGTGEAGWIVLEDGRGGEDALDRAGLYVHLVVAEAVVPADKDEGLALLLWNDRDKEKVVFLTVHHR